MGRAPGEPSRRPPSGGAGRSPTTGLDELRRLGSSVVDPDSSAPMALLAFRPEEAGAALPLSIERTAVEGPLAVSPPRHGASPGAAPHTLEDELGPYDHASVLLCVLDQRRHLPAGMMRLIVPSSSGLKHLSDAERVWGKPRALLFADSGIDDEPRRTLDLATIAVARSYRAAALQGMVTMALCQGLSQIAARCDMTWVVSILHLPVLHTLQWHLQHPFCEFAGLEPRPYLDSPASLPVWMHPESWHARLTERDRVLHDIMVQGRGLEPVVQPPDWDGLAERVREVAALADLRLHLG